MVHDAKEEILIDYDARVKELRAWWQSHPKLPKKIDEILLRRFIHSTYGKTEYTKKVIELNYELRNQYPKVFMDRDPLAEGAQKIFNATDMLPLPQMTPSKYKIIFYRLRLADSDKFDFAEAIKMFFITTDTRMTMTPELAAADVPVFDMKGFSMKHVAKVLKNFSYLRIYMRFTQEALPVRLKQIHLVNVSPLVDRILTIMKPLMRKEVQESLKFHLPNSETIFQDIPRDILPKEYGGDGVSLDDLKKIMENEMKSRRPYLMDPDYWKLNLTRQEEEINGNLTNFKDLAID